MILGRMNLKIVFILYNLLYLLYVDIIKDISYYYMIGNVDIGLCNCFYFFMFDCVI